MIKSREALKDWFETYKELCIDLGDNDLQYQQFNLDSPYHIIERDLYVLELFRQYFYLLPKNLIEDDDLTAIKKWMKDNDDEKTYNND